MLEEEERVKTMPSFRSRTHRLHDQEQLKPNQQEV